jgi:hypothetical protein
VQRRSAVNLRAQKSFPVAQSSEKHPGTGASETRLERWAWSCWLRHEVGVASPAGGGEECAGGVGLGREECGPPDALTAGRTRVGSPPDPHAGLSSASSPRLLCNQGRREQVTILANDEASSAVPSNVPPPNSPITHPH